jgi:hypothetical protein
VAVGLAAGDLAVAGALAVAEAPPVAVGALVTDVGLAEFALAGLGLAATKDATEETLEICIISILDVQNWR